MKKCTEKSAREGKEKVRKDIMLCILFIKKIK